MGLKDIINQPPDGIRLVPEETRILVETVTELSLRYQQAVFSYGEFRTIPFSALLAGLGLEDARVIDLSQFKTITRQEMVGRHTELIELARQALPLALLYHHELRYCAASTIDDILG